MKTRFKALKMDFRFTRSAGYLWLLGVLLAFIPAFASQPAIESDLIFCPLQKAWVKKGGVSAKPVDPLKNVCATDSAKRNFAFESFRQLSASRVVLDDRRTEDLFFGYLKVGGRVFDAVRSAPAPEQSVSDGGASEKSAANGQIVPGKKDVAAVVIAQLSFPNIDSALVSFDRPVVCECKTVRRNSRPRAPPISL